MPSKYWIKLYHEILDDPKMGRLPDHLWRRAIELFLLAGDNDCDGLLPPVEDIAWRLRAEPAEILETLTALQQINITIETDKGWLVVNFCKRQEAASGKERWHQWKERQREQEYYQQSANEIPNDITNESANETLAERLTDTDTDIDKIKTLAAGAASPPIQEKKKPLKYPERDAVIKHFLIKTNLPAPKTDNAHIKETQKRWWTPAADILGWVDNDVGRATALIDRAIKSMKNGKDNLTISSFQSIMSNAADEYAKSGQAPSDIYTKLAEQGYVVRKAN